MSFVVLHIQKKFAHCPLLDTSLSGAPCPHDRLVVIFFNYMIIYYVCACHQYRDSMTQVGSRFCKTLNLKRECRFSIIIYHTYKQKCNIYCFHPLTITKRTTHVLFLLLYFKIVMIFTVDN